MRIKRRLIEKTKKTHDQQLSVCTTNLFRQLLPRGEDPRVRDFRKWRIFPKKKIKIYVKNK